MSGYPDANYAPMPTYVTDVGESCANPCPYTYYDGGAFCSDVTINTNLSVVGEVAAGSLVVGGKSFKPTLIESSIGPLIVLATSVI